MKKTRSLFELFLRWTPRSWGLALFLVTVGPVAAEAAPFVYVTNSGASSSVSATNTVVHTVPAGMTPEWVDITPDGAFAYVVNRCRSGCAPDSFSVSVINTATNTVVHTVPVGVLPFGVAITPF